MEFSAVSVLSLAVLLIASCHSESGLPEEPVEAEEGIRYKSPVFIGEEIYFFDHFDDPTVFKKSWIQSKARKSGSDDPVGLYNGKWEVEAPEKDSLDGDLGLVFKSKVKHGAIASHLRKPFKFEDNTMVLQYEVQFQNSQECGGAYIKLLTGDKPMELSQFHDKTPYTIMFGPDKCGNENKLHFIFRHKNPVNGSIEEKHAKKPTSRIDDVFDGKPHLYTLILKSDNSFKVLVDNKEVNSGSLLEDFNPPVNPPAEIDDPNDFKPSEWDDREKIPDITKTKPEDWDEDAPRTIPDPNAKKPEGWLDNEPVNIRDPAAEKPEDWDVEMDGEWEAPMVANPACEGTSGCGPWSPPMIPNPEYKGKWAPPLIDNPNYMGKWSPKRIVNPNYFEDKQPFKMQPITAVGFELWSMSPNMLFDNILLTNDENIAASVSMSTYEVKMSLLNKKGDSFLSQLISYGNKYPWLWAVYVVLLLIPVTIVVVYCCGSSKEKDLTDDHKKTDSIVEDDESVAAEDLNTPELSLRSANASIAKSTSPESSSYADCYESATDDPRLRIAENLNFEEDDETEDDVLLLSHDNVDEEDTHGEKTKDD